MSMNITAKIEISSTLKENYNLCFYSYSINMNVHFYLWCLLEFKAVSCLKLVVRNTSDYKSLQNKIF